MMNRTRNTSIENKAMSSQNDMVEIETRIESQKKHDEL